MSRGKPLGRQDDVIVWWARAAFLLVRPSQPRKWPETSGISWGPAGRGGAAYRVIAIGPGLGPAPLAGTQSGYFAASYFAASYLAASRHRVSAPSAPAAAMPRRNPPAVMAPKRFSVKARLPPSAIEARIRSNRSGPEAPRLLVFWWRLHAFAAWNASVSGDGDQPPNNDSALPARKSRRSLGKTSVPWKIRERDRMAVMFRIIFRII